MIVLIGLLGMVPVAAQDEDTDDIPDAPITGIVYADDLFVYTGPDYAYRFIGQMPKNASVTIIGRREGGRFSERWLEIDYNGQRAWIFARYVRISVPYDSIPATGRPAPRDGNGRVPEAFDVSVNICNTWPAEGHAIEGDFMAGDDVATFVIPELPGANGYSVYTIAPDGNVTRFSSETNRVTVELRRLPVEAGTYTWETAPYWTRRPERWAWQRLCPRRFAGQFERPAPADD